MAAFTHVNIFSRDIVALSKFYGELFGYAEVEAMRSPIYRLLDCGTTKIGFNAFDAYELLNLSDHASKSGAGFILNFDAESEQGVTDMATRAVALGAQLVKAPYLTYYGRYQAVLLDPESNVFRLNYTVSSGS